MISIFLAIKKKIWQKKPKYSHAERSRWYNEEACEWLRLKHQVYSTELTNKVDRFVQKIKDRIQNVLR